VSALGSFPASLSVLELCAGAGTASLALKLLLGNQARLAGAWDIANNVHTIHEAIHGADESVHLGPSAGDILETELATFPDANILVAGPPCPPFSSQGNRCALGDARARPFERCVEVIRELDSRSASTRDCRDELMFFVLENVQGITHRVRGATGRPESSALDILIHQMRNKLGPTWFLRHMSLNAMDYGLPQSRPRVYLVGRKCKYYPTDILPSRPEHFAHRVRPQQLLDLGDSDSTDNLTTALQRKCDAEWKKIYRTAMDDASTLGSFAFYEVGRDPSGRTAWAGERPTATLDRCQCLRASGPQLRVFSVGEGARPTLDRNLRISERAALQGFPACIGHLKFTEAAGRRIFGNAMAVPVLGSLIATELRYLQANLTPKELVEATQGARTTVGQPVAAVPAVPPPATPPIESDGPVTLAMRKRWASDDQDDEEDILPGQRAAVIAWASNIQEHWAQGQLGRAEKPSCRRTPGDHLALAKRQCLERLGQFGAGSSSSAVGHLTDALAATPPTGAGTSTTPGGQPTGPPAATREGVLEDPLHSEDIVLDSPRHSGQPAGSDSEDPDSPDSVPSMDSVLSVDRTLAW